MPDNQQSSTPMPSLERIQQELASAKSVDDFFGKDGIFARLFATTLEHMLIGGSEISCSYCLGIVLCSKERQKVLQYLTAQLWHMVERTARSTLFEIEVTTLRPACAR